METSILFVSLLRSWARVGEKFCYRHIAPTSAFNPQRHWPCFSTEASKPSICLELALHQSGAGWLERAIWLLRK
jgi:hypothetical protein